MDWVSTSGFNWGNAYEWSSWRTADPLYRDTYDQLVRFGKPVMISEIGTTCDGGNARVWIRQTFQRLRATYPRLHAVLWYDDIDGGGLDFRLQGQTAGALAQPGTLGKGWLQKPRFRVVARRPSRPRRSGRPGSRPGRAGPGGRWRCPCGRPWRIPAGARGSNVFARNGTRTQTYFVPAGGRRRSSGRTGGGSSGRRRSATSTRAGSVTATFTFTHLERFSFLIEMRLGAVIVAGPFRNVRGFSMIVAGSWT